MEEKIKETLSKHSLFWAFLIVVALMVGPTGIEKGFDRIFPPPVPVAVSDELTRIETKQDKINVVLRNQKRILEQFQDFRRQFQKMADDMADLDVRVISLETWQMSTEYTP